MKKKNLMEKRPVGTWLCWYFFPSWKVDVIWVEFFEVISTAYKVLCKCKHEQNRTW